MIVSPITVAKTTEIVRWRKPGIVVVIVNRARRRSGARPFLMILFATALSKPGTFVELLFTILLHSGRIRRGKVSGARALTVFAGTLLNDRLGSRQQFLVSSSGFVVT
jgi:hypothetical protein